MRAYFVQLINSWEGQDLTGLQVNPTKFLTDEAKPLRKPINALRT